VFLHLCASQSAPRLLHGDLHHGNVLLDANRGWLAIDPKGAIGEIEFEFGAALRNPCERPELFTAETTIERRVARYSNGQRNAGRILGWAFAQAVLATLWELEDSQRLEAGKGWIALADRVRPMLRGVADA
jgi:streptomycin 6-kinase